MKNKKFSLLFCFGKILYHWLWPPKLQHTLALLTMAVGSLTLAATFFIGEGALNSLWKDLDRLMGNRIDVYADVGPNDIMLKKRPSVDLLNEDLEYIKSRLPWVKYVVPMFFGRARVRSRSSNMIMQLDGIVPKLTKDVLYLPLKGRSFSNPGLKGVIMECLVTGSAAETLKIDLTDSPYIMIERERFKVVGIVPDPPDTGPRFSNRIILPYITAQVHFGTPGKIKVITVTWKNPKDMDRTVKALGEALDQCRAPGGYYLSSSTFRIKKGHDIVNKFMLYGTVQAFFAIFIASIGIISVMLSNVVHRTREFAIRIAMGADHKELSLLILTESVLMGLLGAAVGILLAVPISPLLIGVLAERIPGTSQLDYLINLKGIVFPLVVCGLCALFAGIIPSVRVKRMDILAAIRAE
jgi:ABC-type lipoprotein release transport system permease subunit